MALSSQATHVPSGQQLGVKVASTLCCPLAWRKKQVLLTQSWAVLVSTFLHGTGPLLLRALPSPSLPFCPPQVLEPGGAGYRDTGGAWFLHRTLYRLQSRAGFVWPQFHGLLATCSVAGRVCRPRASTKLVGPILFSRSLAGCQWGVRHSLLQAHFLL